MIHFTVALTISLSIKSSCYRGGNIILSACSPICSSQIFSKQVSVLGRTKIAHCGYNIIWEFVVGVLHRRIKLWKQLIGFKLNCDIPVVDVHARDCGIKTWRPFKLAFSHLTWIENSTFSQISLEKRSHEFARYFSIFIIQKWGFT